MNFQKYRRKIFKIRKKKNKKKKKKTKINEKKIYGFRISISLNKIIFLLQQQ